MRRNRWTILAGLSLCNLCMGASYIWSVFYLPLVDSCRWSMSSVSLAYSLMLLCSLMGSILSAHIQAHVSIRARMLMTAVMWGGGWFLTGFAGELWQLYLCFGVIAGLGTGIGYNTIIGTIPLCFSDRLGLANGLATSSAGFSPILFAPISYALLARLGVQAAFRIVGLIFFAGIAAAACLTDMPRSAGGADQTVPSVSERDQTTAEMIRDPVFYLMWFVLTAGCTAGMMFSGHASSIGQKMLGLTADEAALSVSALAVGSVIGRILVGMLSDRIGRFRTIAGILLVILADMLWLCALHTAKAFLLSVVAIGFSYGSLMAVYPTVCADLFGRGHHASNWALLYSGMTFASLLGPTTAAVSVENSGSYINVYLLSAGLALLGLLVLCIARRAACGRLN